MLLSTSTRLYDPTLSLPGATVQPMFLSNDVSHSDPALSSLSPRIPKTLCSRSSVGIEVLGCGTVQFGSADTVDESQRGRMVVSVLT